ncbi:hypothetical protein GALL_407350 [mine drainage metagenome]|uniref:Uncharacterized protein n=1 Tax=mine drainage metagenome TaxID=410659 RepID=A0A1J5Q1M3_9ZZZZ
MHRAVLMAMECKQVNVEAISRALRLLLGEQGACRNKTSPKHDQYLKPLHTGSRAADKFSGVAG